MKLALLFHKQNKVQSNITQHSNFVPIEITQSTAASGIFIKGILYFGICCVKRKKNAWTEMIYWLVQIVVIYLDQVNLTLHLTNIFFKYLSPKSFPFVCF